MPHAAHKIRTQSSDTLTQAFTRFLNLNGYAPTCSRACQPRRHGSNAPGPLEARRRHARRRMGLAAHAAAGGGAGVVDVGALFGLGAAVPRDMEKTVRWQPPAMFAPPPPAPTPVASPVASPWQLVRPKATTRGVEEPVRVDEVKQAVAASRVALRQLLASIEGAEEVSVEHMAEIVAFLHGPQDEPLAENLLALTEWLRDRATSQEALHSLAACVRDKAILGTLNTDQVVSTTTFLLQRMQDPGIEPALSETLNALPGLIMHASICRISRQLRLSLPFERKDQRLQGVADVERWFRVLDAVSHLQGRNAKNPTWNEVYDAFAEHIQPSELYIHFRKLYKEDFAKVLIRHWVIHWSKVPAGSAGASDYGFERRLAFGRVSQVSTDLIDRLLEDFSERRASRWRRYGHPPQSNGKLYVMFADILSVLASNNIHSPKPIHELFNYLTNDCPQTVFELISRISCRPALGIPTPLAGHLVRYFMSLNTRNNLYRAYWTFEMHPSLPLSECPELPVRLLESGFCSPDKIFLLLNRKVGPETPLVEFRRNETLTLSEQHIDVVQLVAFAWANDVRIPSRVAFRRVWECYRFLQDRSAPLSALMSRALVRSGILRPLQDGKLVPFAQKKYIVSLVQRIEGDDVARNLDRMAFQLNQGAHESGRVRVVAAGNARLWAGRQDAGIARQVRWRMKLWTRKKGRWYGGDDAQPNQKVVDEFAGSVPQVDPIVRDTGGDKVVQFAICQSDSDKLLNEVPTGSPMVEYVPMAVRVFTANGSSGEARVEQHSWGVPSVEELARLRDVAVDTVEHTGWREAVDEDVELEAAESTVDEVAEADAFESDMEDEDGEVESPIVSLRRRRAELKSRPQHTGMSKAWLAFMAAEHVPAESEVETTDAAASNGDATQTAFLAGTGSLVSETTKLSSKPARAVHAQKWDVPATAFYDPHAERSAKAEVTKAAVGTADAEEAVTFTPFSTTPAETEMKIKPATPTPELTAPYNPFGTFTADEVVSTAEHAYSPLPLVETPRAQQEAVVPTASTSPSQVVWSPEASEGPVVASSQPLESAAAEPEQPIALTVHADGSLSETLGQIYDRDGPSPIILQGEEAVPTAHLNVRREHADSADNGQNLIMLQADLQHPIAATGSTNSDATSTADQSSSGLPAFPCTVKQEHSRQTQQAVKAAAGFTSRTTKLPAKYVGRAKEKAYARRAREKSVHSMEMKMKQCFQFTDQGQLCAKDPGAWRDFAKRHFERRKRMGYDTFDQSFGER